MAPICLYPQRPAQAPAPRTAPRAAHLSAPGVRVLREPMPSRRASLLGQGLPATLGVKPAAHQLGRQQLLDGWALAFPGEPPPSVATLQVLGAVSCSEAPYGLTWGGAMQGSNNWGAITCGKSPDSEGNCPAGCSPYGDSMPTADGQKKYTTCFRRWATPAEGAAGLMLFLHKWPEVWAAILCGNLDAVSWGMRQRGYYLGFTTDKRAAAEAHAKGLDKWVGEISAALGEPRAAERLGQDSPDCPGGGSSALALPGADDVGDVALLVALALGVWVFARWRAGLSLLPAALRGLRIGRRRS